MKKNIRNGFTLLELLICITLLSIVILFLFRLINDVRHEGDSGSYIKEIYLARNEIMNKAGSVISKYGVCGIDTSLSTSDHAIVKMHICNGITMNLDVTSNTFKYSYDGDEYTYKVSDPTITIDPNFTLTNSQFITYEFYELVFATHKKGLKDTTVDDIGFYYGLLKESSSLIPLKVYDCMFDESDECEIQVEYDGTYVLELWGGKGEDGIGVFNGTPSYGGYGSYTYAEIKLNKGDWLHVGLSKGGKCYGNPNTSWYGTGNADYGKNGGNAPFIAFHKIGDGYLSSYANYKDEVIAVAGGGGGASTCDTFTGKYGSDPAEFQRRVLNGHNAMYVKNGAAEHLGIYYAYGGGFGAGAACDIEPNFCGGCGGGGYYGGFIGKETFGYATSSPRSAGQGGQPYYNINYVKNGIHYVYDDILSNTYANRFVETTCVGYAQVKCANNGNPYVKITMPQHIGE